MEKYISLDKLMNFKDSDIEVLKTNLTSNPDYDSYYTAMENDSDNGFVIPITAMEYKNLVLLENFIKNAMNCGLEKWEYYSKCVEAAEKAYNITWNVATKEVDKLNGKVDILKPGDM